MTTNTKKLAEFGAEFVNLLHVTDFYFFPYGSAHCFTIKDSKVEDYFFHNPEYSPILAHVAKREMKRLRWDINYSTYNSTHDYTFEKVLDDSGEKIGGVDAQDKNEFIALWTAIQKAVEGK